MTNGLDAATQLETLIRNSWDSSNTFNHSPEVMQITDPESKRYDFNTNKVLILIHRPVFAFPKAGTGHEQKSFRHTVRIDIRVLGKELENLYINTYNELLRILDVNIRNPWSGVQELDYQDGGGATDLSDKNKGLFRIVQKVDVINRCVVRAGVE